MILDIIAGFGILFLAGSIGLSVLVLGFSVIAPLFIKNPVPTEQGRYVRVNERAYDYDED